MFRLVIVLLSIAVLSAGCAASNGPSIGNPCKDRSFDEWLSFYELKDKANSSWDEGYAKAFVWLDDVAHACYPDKFNSDVPEVVDASKGLRCGELPSSDLEPSYIAECDLLTLDSYEKVEVK